MVFLRDIDRTDICGYLGNNLFQLLAGYSLSRKNGVDICVPDTWEYRDVFKKNYFRSIPKSVIENHIKSEYNEPSFSYQEIPYQENLNLNGYFQSEKYFKETNVKELLEPKLEIKNSILETFNLQLDKPYDEIFAYHKVTAIHVRQGDYKNFPHVFCNLSQTDYYQTAIERLDDYTDYFLVFSNDIPYCKKFLKGDKFIFSESDQEKSQGNKSSVHDLYLMSMCNNFIVANSSFSWWAAYLGDSLKKKVIAPKNWFMNNLHDTRDLLPESWIQI